MLFAHEECVLLILLRNPTTLHTIRRKITLRVLFNGRHEILLLGQAHEMVLARDIRVEVTAAINIRFLLCGTLLLLSRQIYLKHLRRILLRLLLSLNRPILIIHHSTVLDFVVRRLRINSLLAGVPGDVRSLHNVQLS